ncbi:TonB-dependent receptor plug domain-containing protein [Thauera mechernichensis]|uniref:TonB-dependent receptor plug domain-containing protein n=1 Tax=Thauera mechernichensis TaxID=82788 RepID=UPI00241069BC|nr:TonB-dependent receptor [Thauera mechernichensis]
MPACRFNTAPSPRLAALTLAIGLALQPTVSLATKPDPVLAEIVVHPEKDDFDARQQSASTRLVYGREELDRMNELTVGDYLRRLPSVTFTGPPGNPKDVRMRGMDKGYTQILIDGEAVASGTKERQIQVDRIPLDMVERIEVIRAPSADMPSEGMMGTINIVLREPPDKRVANARIATGRLFGEKTDTNTWNLSGQYGDASDSVRWLLSASVGDRGDLKSKSKDETSYHNNPTNAPKDRKLEFEDERARTRTVDFAPRINIRLSAVDELVLTPWFTRSDESKEKSRDKFKYAGTSIIGDGQTQEDEDKLRETWRLRGEWKRKIEDGKLSIYAAAQQGTEKKDKSTLDYRSDGTLSKVAVERDDKDESDWYLGARGERKLGRHTVSAGLEYRDARRKDGKTKEEGASWAALSAKDPGRGDRFDISEQRWTAFVQDEIRLDSKHILTPGLRAIHVRQGAIDAFGAKSTAATDSLNPSLHYLWKFDPRNNLRASATQTLKPPKFDDLSTVTESKSGTSADPDKSGNPELKPERAVGLELGWEHFLPDGGGVLGANVFHRDIKDKVEKISGLEGSRWVERPQNVGDAKVWGWELDARPQMDIIGLPELMLRFNYTRLYSRITDSATGMTTRIKDQPPYVYNIGFDWQLPRLRASWGLNYNYTPKYLKNPTEPLKADYEAGQELLDAYVSTRITPDLSLRLTASNLLDMRKVKDKTTYHSNGRLDKTSTETERGGRSIMLALEGRW